MKSGGRVRELKQFEVFNKANRNIDISVKSLYSPLLFYFLFGHVWLKPEAFDFIFKSLNKINENWMSLIFNLLIRPLLSPSADCGSDFKFNYVYSLSVYVLIR